ncbi:atrial natriuretic peptide receptor 3-like [Pecten maximus]|uniref:atrial natriuretic peptide receptor 3-like n=1 Tax=Pecten maximus TaxID=6579 RepID=UPI00145848EE|nr:atrial natriuretic peptide receptor 3-like [Pecten maximus]
MGSKQRQTCCCIVLLSTVLSVSSIVVKIATILPADNRRIFSIDRITPAIQMAIDELSNNYTLVENLTFSVEYANSQCSIAEGINQAIDFYINRKVDAFFGPVCDYAVAPVARQTRFWNIPLISGGAMARDFAIYRKSQYPKLTRVGPVNFNSLSDFFVKLFRHSGWKSLKILYNRKGHANVFEDFCHLCVEAIHYDMIEKAREIKQDYFRLDEKTDLRKILFNEVGLTFGGR